MCVFFPSREKIGQHLKRFCPFVFPEAMLSTPVIMSVIKDLAVSETQDLLDAAFQSLKEAKLVSYFMLINMTKQTGQTGSLKCTR